MNDVYNDLFEIQSLVCQSGPYRAQRLNLSLGALVLPDVNF